MLILECSQGCDGRTDDSVTISLRNFGGEGIKSLISLLNYKKKRKRKKNGLIEFMIRRFLIISTFSFTFSNFNLIF